MSQILGISLVMLGTLSLAQPAYARAESDPHIEIVTGMYGMPGAKHVLDITGRLQDICGPDAEHCDVFCSDSSFGRYNIGDKPICRVTYRCGANEVRSVEAWREEPILMRCPERSEEAATPSAPVNN